MLVCKFIICIKVARRAKYLMQEITPSVSAFEHTATATARKAKYLQVPAQSVASASENLVAQNKIVSNLLNRFNSYLGKDIDSIPIEDCIELKNLLVSSTSISRNNQNSLYRFRCLYQAS